MTEQPILIKNVRPFAGGKWQNEQDILLENGVWGSGSPLFGQTLKGKIVGTYLGAEWRGV